MKLIRFKFYSLTAYCADCLANHLTALAYWAQRQALITNHPDWAKFYQQRKDYLAAKN